MEHDNIEPVTDYKTRYGIINKPKIAPYTYGMFNDSVNKIHGDIVDTLWIPDYVVGLVRGGLIPGVALSHKLDKPFLAIHWGRNEQKRSKKLEKILKKGKQILFVEDIVDSAFTIRSLYEYTTRVSPGALENIKIAALVDYSDGVYCTFPGIYNFNNERPWVKFFWEEK